MELGLLMDFPIILSEFHSKTLKNVMPKLGVEEMLPLNRGNCTLLFTGLL